MHVREREVLRNKLISSAENVSPSFLWELMSIQSPIYWTLLLILRINQGFQGPEIKVQMKAKDSAGMDTFMKLFLNCQPAASSCIHTFPKQQSQSDHKKGMSVKYPFTYERCIHACHFAQICT